MAGTSEKPKILKLQGQFTGNASSRAVAWPPETRRMIKTTIQDTTAAHARIGCAAERFASGTLMANAATDESKAASIVTISRTAYGAWVNAWTRSARGPRSHTPTAHSAIIAPAQRAQRTAGGASGVTGDAPRASSMIKSSVLTVGLSQQSAQRTIAAVRGHFDR